jgi:hypothetical protein
VDSLLVWLVPKRKTAVMPTMPNCTTTVWRSGTELVLLLVLGQQTVAGSLFFWVLPVKMKCECLIDDQKSSSLKEAKTVQNFHVEHFGP